MRFIIFGFGGGCLWQTIVTPEFPATHSSTGGSIFISLISFESLVQRDYTRKSDKHRTAANK